MTPRQQLLAAADNALRAAAQELVALKDLADNLGAEKLYPGKFFSSESERYAAELDYRTRKPLAWAALRAELAKPAWTAAELEAAKVEGAANAALLAKPVDEQAKDARAAFEAWKRMPGQNVTPGEAWFAAVKWARQP
jgi:hypothetical protein